MQDKSKSTMDKSQMDKSKSTETDTKSGNMNAQTKGTDSKAAADTKAGDAKSQTTTGTASATASAPPPEKRTEITSAIKSTKIEETTNVNFNISGCRDPASVRFHPLPPRIVEIYPEWRGYDVIYVRGQYIIVRPQTREIVYIIEG